MATTGYQDIAEFNRAELMIAPSLQTEGKQLQSSQGVGMGSRGAAVGAHSSSADAGDLAEKTPALAEA
jgi:IMP dehydrogenase